MSRFAVALFLGLAAILSTPAHAIPYFKDNLPDFYQHQKAGAAANLPDGDLGFSFTNPAPRPPDPPGVPSYDTTRTWWEYLGGWCCVAAFVNSFYFLEKTHGFTGLFTRADKEAAFQAANGRPPTWQEQMIFAIEDLARDMGFGEKIPPPSPPNPPDQGGPEYLPTVGVPSIAKHVRKLEAGKRTPLSYKEFNVTAGFGTATPTVTGREADLMGDFSAPPVAVPDTLFDLYRKELCRSEDVTLKIQFPKDTGPADGSRPWWAQPRGDEPFVFDATGAVLGEYFHVVTGAGIEGCTDATKKGKIYVADPDKRNQLVGGAYTGTDVRERYPYTDIPFPAPGVGDTDAQKMAFYDELNFGANGCIAQSPVVPAYSYQGACITRLTAISPTPEPVTTALFATGLALIGALSRRRRNAAIA